VRPPEDLFVVHRDVSFVDRPVLVHAFSGFVEAAGATRVAAEHLLATREHRLLATFDSDELLDYRARRPRMSFRSDHFAAVDVPEVTLHEVVDAAGTPFLLLTGPEPDYQWRRFIAAVRALVERFDVRLTVGLAAFPWPAPHTRPIGLTLHGTDPSLLRGHSSAVGSLEVPGHVGGLLELWLGEAGHPAMGVAAQVPHYLVQFEYPRVAMALLDGLADATGLVLPSDGLETAARSAEAEVAAQVAGSTEIAEVVRALEQQHDALSPPGADGSVLAPGGTVPTGDEIAAQVERFLAGMGEEDPPA
jgi:PAC2 family